MSPPRTPGARQTRATESRQRLLDAAIAQFSKRQYDDVAVADIATAAGAAHGSLFHHFGDKRGIYLAAMQDLAARFSRRRIDSTGTPGPDGLRRIVDLQLSAIAREPGLFRQLTLIGLDTDPDAQQIFEQDRWEAVDAMCVHLGLDSSVPAVRIALRGAIGGLDHAALTWLALDRPVTLERLIDGVIASLRGALDSVETLDPTISAEHGRSVIDQAVRATRDVIDTH